jgi:hypothetical protein
MDTMPDWYAEYRRKAEAGQLDAQQIKPCPSCGHPRVYSYMLTSGWWKHQCAGCGLTGPATPTESIGVETWNAIPRREDTPPAVQSPWVSVTERTPPLFQIVPVLRRGELGDIFLSSAAVPFSPNVIYWLDAALVPMPEEVK